MYEIWIVHQYAKYVLPFFIVLFKILCKLFHVLRHETVVSEESHLGVVVTEGEPDKLGVSGVCDEMSQLGGRESKWRRGRRRNGSLGHVELLRHVGRRWSFELFGEGRIREEA